MLFSKTVVFILLSTYGITTTYGDLLLHPNQILLNRFIIKEGIGAGGEGEVYVVKDKKDQGEKVIKIFNRKQRTPGDIKYFRILKQYATKKTFVLVPIGTFEYDGKHAAVYDKMEGDLLDRRTDIILKSRTDHMPLKWEIEELQTLIKNILTALNAIHRIFLVHGDVKDSNILRKESQYFLGDLGLLRPKSPKDIRRGSPCTWPPEYFLTEEPRLDTSFDIWSFGITILMLFADHDMCPPSNPDKKERYEETQKYISKLLEVNKKTNRAEYLTLLDEYDSVYDEESQRKFRLFKDLVSKMLNPDPNKRITAEKALKHWFLH